MSWELSPLYRHSAPSLSVFSPSHTNKILVSSHQDRLILRDPATLQIKRTWKLSLNLSVPKPLREHSTRRPLPSSAPLKPAVEAPPLTTLAISPGDSPLILAYAARASVAWVLDPEQDEPVARIEVGAEGAVAMAWSGTGDTILVWSAHHLRLTLHRLDAPSPALHIQQPKLAAPLGYAFRPQDSRYLAVAERHAGRDHVGIYDCSSWKLLRHFALPSTTSDIADLSWSPCGRYLAVWETLTDYILHIYTPDGRLLSTFTPYSSLAYTPASTTTNSRSRQAEATIEQRPAAQGSYDLERAREERSTEGWVGLGIRTVQWHPTGDWLAVGGWDGKIRILTRLAWAPVAELSHVAKIVAPTASAYGPEFVPAQTNTTAQQHVWREPKDWIEKTRGKGIVAFDAQILPYSASSVRPDLGKPYPKMGISELSWSPSGRWLASYNQSFPSSLWIYSFISSPVPHFRPRLHSLLVHSSPIREFRWKPSRNSLVFEDRELLAISTGGKGFTTWREPGVDVELSGVAEGVGIPASTPFAPCALRFSPSGDALLLADREIYAMAYPVREGAVDEADRTWIGGED